MDEGMEEGMGESSSPSSSVGTAEPYDIRNDIYERLIENGNEEAISNPDLREQLDDHFSRLPSSYGVDVNFDRAEDVLIHHKLLVEAKDPEKCPVFHVRFIKLEDMELKKNTEETEDGTDEMEATFASQEGAYVPVHEIVFATIDKPKLLSQLSALLSDIGLNIREAHVFSTTDGYSLDIFVVDGWPVEDTEGLHKEVEVAIAAKGGSWSISSHSLATENILSLQAHIGAWEIDRKMLKMGEKIACGPYGDTYRGSYLGQDVAIKVKRHGHIKETGGGEFAQEITILREVQHRNIVRFIGACTKPPQFCILTEYMPRGSLYDFLHKHQNTLELSMLLKVALDVCRGMDYLHQNNIIHRDLKTANLLMDNSNVVKVADFGVSRVQGQGGVMTAETGTYRWMAPEVLSHQAYDKKADVFSFAIVLWELATSKIPYDTMTPMQAALGVRQGVRPQLPENNTHPRLLDLMQRCWNANPAKRPTFKDIIVELEELLEQTQATVEAIHQGKSASEEADIKLFTGG